MPLRVQDRAATAEEVGLVAAIRAGDERAFTTVVERHYAAMLALAKAYVVSPDTATQVVHDAWMAALAASDGFDGGTSLRAWLLRCVVRAAAPSTARRDGAGPETTQPAVDPRRFRDGDDAFAGHWRAYPRDWRTLRGAGLRGADVRRVVAGAVGSLPPYQRAVLTLRDVVGCSMGEACDVLELPEALARAHLHQARSRVRAALERHFDG
jgi:RNA polymerase sigma-70 factor (ECF subfamily)